MLSYIIALKMLYWRQKWEKLKQKCFNKKAAKSKNKPDQIIEAIELKLRQFITDIGSGGSHFTLKFADRVGGEGRVYYIDTNPEFLQFIKANAKKG